MLPVDASGQGALLERSTHARLQALYGFAATVFLSGGDSGKF